MRPLLVRSGHRVAQMLREELGCNKDENWDGQEVGDRVRAELRAVNWGEVAGWGLVEAELRTVDVGAVESRWSEVMCRGV